MRYLLKAVDTYRVATVSDVEKLHDELLEDSTFDLVAFSYKTKYLIQQTHQTIFLYLLDLDFDFVSGQKSKHSCHRFPPQTSTGNHNQSSVYLPDIHPFGGIDFLRRFLALDNTHKQSDFPGRIFPHWLWCNNSHRFGIRSFLHLLCGFFFFPIFCAIFISC